MSRLLQNSKTANRAHRHEVPYAHTHTHTHSLSLFLSHSHTLAHMLTSFVRSSKRIMDSCVMPKMRSTLLFLPGTCIVCVFEVSSSIKRSKEESTNRASKK